MNDIDEDVFKLQCIVDCSRLGTWEWNVQTGETVFNDLWARIIGYTLEELTPISIKTWEALSHPDDFNKSRELLKCHFSGELPYFENDCRMKHRNGNWIWVHDRGKVVSWTTDGKPLLMFGTHTDITERKRIEDAEWVERLRWRRSGNEIQRHLHL